MWFIITAVAGVTQLGQWEQESQLYPWFIRAAVAGIVTAWTAGADESTVIHQGSCSRDSDSLDSGGR